MNHPIDAPKILTSPEAREERRRALAEPHVAPLAEFVAELRVQYPDAGIPDFDPWDGGVHAELLYLLEAPGPKAVLSGFISRNNPDETAKNFFLLNQAVGLDRKRTVIWNVVPWYVGNETRIRAVSGADIAEARESLRRLLGLLPSLRAIALVGGKAQRAERLVREVAPGARIFRTPHPSPLFVNNKPGNRGLLEQRLREIAIYLGGR